MSPSRTKSPASHADRLVGLNRTELAELMTDLGQPAYRAAQLAEWIYAKGACEWGEMTNLPAALRTGLSARFDIGRGRVTERRDSKDGTIKSLIAQPDHALVETVALPYEDRASVCVSTQVGCPVRCPFCATGLSGFGRHLAAGEIVDQVLTCQQQLQRRISHVVFMGMGEPLLNYDPVLKAVRLLNEEVGIAMRHLTISTVGIVPAMERLAAEDLQLTLAVSLHAPVDEVRQELIPISRKYPLNEVLAACRRYQRATNRRLTFEYVLLRDINDAPEFARLLARRIRGFRTNVNVIPYNNIGDGSRYRAPERSRVARFREALETEGVVVTQRMERGADIMAACGQLRRYAKAAA